MGNRSTFLQSSSRTRMSNPAYERLQGLLVYLSVSSPALAVRYVLQNKNAVAREFRRQMNQGVWTPRVAPGTEARELLRKELGQDPPCREGCGDNTVWCLGVEDIEWPSGEKCRVGIPRRLRPRRGGTQTGSFESGCSFGAEAALAWFQEKCDLGVLPSDWRFELGTLGSADASPARGAVGPSAGLAAALSLAGELLRQSGIPLTASFAATGEVKPWGSVERVDEVKEKLEAVVREIPHVQAVFVPWGNESDVPRNGKVQVIPVRKVGEALDVVCRGFDFNAVLAKWSPLEASAHALTLELEQKHEQAATLARQAREHLRGVELADAQHVEAVITCLSVIAINETHRGNTAAAVQVLGDARKILDQTASARSGWTPSLDVRALMAVARSTALIDALKAGEAVEALTRVFARGDDLALMSRPLVAGTLLRAQLAAGMLDDASKTWEQYKERTGRPEDLPRMWCYGVEMLVKRVKLDGEKALEQAKIALDAGREANERVATDWEKRQNERYLALAEGRICAAEGDAERALELASVLPTDPVGHWPDHHRHRLAGEALARAGRGLEAVERLEAAHRSIFPEGAGDSFERLVLLTAAAREAIVRLEIGLNGWEEPAEVFASALERYAAGRFVRPDGTGGAAAWLAYLRDSLECIPY